MNIILNLIFLIAKILVLIILLYFGMLFYFAYKDGTIYEYKEFQCKNKNFTNSTPMSLSHSTYNKTIKLQIYTDKTTQETYPINSKFKFLSLYSLYDFEGGTFYHYLIEDENGIKSFVSFDDIDPQKCTLDIDDKFWFKNIQEYLPEGKKVKISKSTRDKVFDTNGKQK